MKAPLDPAYVLDQYEAMRREALGGNLVGSRGRGLAVLWSRGMPAWLAALSILDGAHVPHPRMADMPLAGVPEFTAGVRSELMLVWAGMVLACSQETAAT
jgi:hypothetical protein